MEMLMLIGFMNNICGNKDDALVNYNQALRVTIYIFIIDVICYAE